MLKQRYFLEEKFISILSVSFFEIIRHSSHKGRKSAELAQKYTNLWNDLGFSLYAASSNYHVVATLDKRKKSVIGMSTD